MVCGVLVGSRCCCITLSVIFRRSQTVRGLLIPQHMVRTQFRGEQTGLYRFPYLNSGLFLGFPETLIDLMEEPFYKKLMEENVSDDQYWWSEVWVEENRRKDGRMPRVCIDSDSELLLSIATVSVGVSEEGAAGGEGRLLEDSEQGARELMARAIVEHAKNFHDTTKNTAPVEVQLHESPAGRGLSAGSSRILSTATTVGPAATSSSTTSARRLPEHTVLTPDGRDMPMNDNGGLPQVSIYPNAAFGSQWHRRDTDTYPKLIHFNAGRKGYYPAHYYLNPNSEDIDGSFIGFQGIGNSPTVLLMGGVWFGVLRGATLLLCLIALFAYFRATRKAWAAFRRGPGLREGRRVYGSGSSSGAAE